MPADLRVDDLDAETDHVHDDEDGQEIQQPVSKTRDEAARVVAYSQPLQQRATPATGAGQSQFAECAVGLEAGVPHAEHGAGQDGEEHDDHDTLEIDRVTHVWRATRSVSRRIEQRVDHFEDGIEFFEAPVLRKMRFEPVELFAQEFQDSTILLDLIQGCA